jgi:hypothetical protein
VGTCLFTKPLLSNGSCIFAYIEIVAQQRVYMLQCKWWWILYFISKRIVTIYTEFPACGAISNAESFDTAADANEQKFTTPREVGKLSMVWSHRMKQQQFALEDARNCVLLGYTLPFRWFNEESRKLHDQGIMGGGAFRLSPPSNRCSGISSSCNFLTTRICLWFQIYGTFCRLKTQTISSNLQLSWTSLLGNNFCW